MKFAIELLLWYINEPKKKKNNDGNLIDFLQYNINNILFLQLIEE